MKTEPVLTAGAIAGVIMAGLAMAVSLGWLNLADSQMRAIQAFVLPVLGLVLPIGAALWARGKVTPVASPKTADGQDAVIIPAAQAQMLGVAPLDDPELEPLPRHEAGRNLR